MKTKVIVGIFFLFFCIHLSAQNENKPYEDGFLKRFAISAKVGSYGPGVDLHTSLLPNLKLRAGFNYMAYTYDKAIDFTADNAAGSGEVDGSINMAKLRFPNANLLFDFYPIKSGIFCFTVGAYMGNNKVTVDGMADGEFVFEDVVIKPGTDGKFNAHLKMGETFKPYFGIGLGRTIPNSRVSFRFDLGAVYQGEYKVESDYTDNSININDKASADFDLPFSKELLKLWPMFSFSISYRIK